MSITDAVFCNLNNVDVKNSLNHMGLKRYCLCKKEKFPKSDTCTVPLRACSTK